MNNFEFISPTKIYFGKEQENRIGEIIRKYGFKKVLFHYGQSSIKKTGLYDRIVNSLNANEVKFVELGGVEPNPKVSLVRIGVELAKKENVDFILAVGGGSVIDSAKLISCGAKVDFDPWLFSIHQEVAKENLPVGVVLTISAAGSELSSSCVISNSDNNIKNGFNTDLNRPLFAIMNPELTFTVSKYQTACGIVDIMMHTLERYFSDVEDLVFTDSISLALIRSVMEAGKRAINNPTDYNARAALMIASSYSHNGLTGLGTNVYFTVHKLEHILSGVHDEIAHGAGLSILFPGWAKYTSPLLKDKWIRFGREIFNIDLDEKEEMINKTISNLKDFFKSLGMPISLKEVNVTEEEFAKLASLATKNNSLRVIGVRELNYNDVLEILKICL